MGEDDGIGFARNSRTRSVDDRDDLRPLFAGVADRLDRIHRFAALRNRDNQGLLANDWVSVAEFAGELDLDGDTAPVLNRVTCNLPRIGGSSAANHDDLVDPAQDVFGDADLVQSQVLVRVHAIGKSISHASRLFVDFLLHEGRPSALGRAIRGKINLVFLQRNRMPIRADDRYSGSAHDNELILADFHRTIRVLDKIKDIRAEEVLSLTQANNQRRRSARGNDDIGRFGGQREQSKSALELGGYFPHGNDQPSRDGLVSATQPRNFFRVRGRIRLIVGARKQVHDHFRIGFRGKNRALCTQPGAQFVRVFDDSIVDKREASVGADVGVSVCNRWAPVSCPTGVPDPGVSIGWRILIHGLAQVDQLADGLNNVQFSRTCQGDSCRVISAVFQA